MRALAILLVLGSLARPASADDLACSRTRDRQLADGPVVIGLFDADFGTAPSACLQRDVSLTERGGATLNLSGLYGSIRADTILAMTYRLRKKIALIAAIEVVHYELALDAVIQATELGLGQSTLGLAGEVLETRRFAVTVYGRVLVPTSSASTDVQRSGAEAGVTALFRPRRDVELHAQADGDFTAALAKEPHVIRGGATLMLGVQYAPARWFAFAVDAAVVVGHLGAFDAFVPMLSLRFRPYRGLNLELAAEAPLEGRDPRTLIAALRVGYRF